MELPRPTTPDVGQLGFSPSSKSEIRTTHVLCAALVIVAITFAIVTL